VDVCGPYKSERDAAQAARGKPSADRASLRNRPSATARKPTPKKLTGDPPPARPARSLEEIGDESRRLIDASEDTLRRLRELQSDVVDQVAKLADSRATSESNRERRSKS
jgi:hypothetical protein